MKISMTSMFCAIAALMVATTANAAFIEDFNGMTIGDLVGQSSGGNVWQIPGAMTGTSIKVTASQGPDGSQSVIANYEQPRGGAIAIDAATLAQFGTIAGTFILEMDMLPAHYPTSKNLGLGVGTSGILNNGDNWLYSMMNVSGTDDLFRSMTNNVYDGDSNHAKTYIRADDVYQHHMVQVDLDASGIVTAARAYIDGNLAGTWAFGGETPNWIPTHVAFYLDSSMDVSLRDGNADNFAYSFVPIPEPTSLALLGLGLLTLRRRR